MHKPGAVLSVTKFTGTSTDMLAATNLAKIPGAGTILAWIGSTVNTATFQAPQQNPAIPSVADAVVLATSGVPLLNETIPYAVRVAEGNAPTFILGGTTGTCYLIAAFYPD